MMRPDEPDYDAVEGAEIMMEVLVRDLPTDVVYELLGWRAAGGINPSFVPAPVHGHYSVIWWNMDAQYATQALKRVLEPVMATRSVYVTSGPCPKCQAPGATIRIYDCGAYLIAEHRALHIRELQGAGLLVSNMTRHCYVGPTPKPATYQKQEA